MIPQIYKFSIYYPEIHKDPIFFFSLLHLFSWSGLLDSEMLLKEAFQVPNLKTGKMEPLISALTEKEEEQFRNMLTRLHTIMQAAKDLDVRVMIDAEQTYFQPAISRLVIHYF